MPCYAGSRGEFSYWSLSILIQTVRSEQQPSRHRSAAAADPEAGRSRSLGTSVDIDSEEEGKFLKIILGKADRIGGSPRFCKRRWLLQPSRGGAFAPEHLLLCPIRIRSHIAQPSTEKCGWCSRIYLSKWFFFAVSTAHVAHRPIVCLPSVNLAAATEWHGHYKPARPLPNTAVAKIRAVAIGGSWPHLDRNVLLCVKPHLALVLPYICRSGHLLEESVCSLVSSNFTLY